MGTFITAYLALWTAVMLYVMRLGTRQRHLERMLDDLEAPQQHAPLRASSSEKAA